MRGPYHIRRDREGKRNKFRLILLSKDGEEKIICEHVTTGCIAPQYMMQQQATLNTQALLDHDRLYAAQQVTHD